MFSNEPRDWDIIRAGGKEREKRKKRSLDRGKFVVWRFARAASLNLWFAGADWPRKTRRAFIGRGNVADQMIERMFFANEIFSYGNAQCDRQFASKKRVERRIELSLRSCNISIGRRNSARNFRSFSSSMPFDFPLLQNSGVSLPRFKISLL